MSLAEAELLLRKDLKKFCGMFSAYGKDSLLLAALAYNVGPYRILGCKKKYPKSTLLKKIEAGIRDFKSDYVQFCRWKSKRIPSIERRRYAEWTLLYIR
jgi:lysozyme